MCGIVGIFNMTNAKDTTFSEKDKSFLIKYLLSELTMETESRGKDATGYFSLFQDGNGVGLKHGIKATDFCTKDWDEGEYTFQNHLKLLEAYHNEVSPVASALSHCRAKTIGPETDNDNNHPIYVGDLVGIHNGCLSNHSKIYSNIKEEIERIGAVDSEMIVQLLWLATEKGEKEFDTSMVKYVTEKLDGSYAFICLNKKDPNSVFFIRDTRPIEFIYLRQAGLLVVVSEKKFFSAAIKKYNWFRFYGIDAPKVEYEEYTLPDDKGFVLKLDTEITSETKIEDFIGEVIKINNTEAEWKDTVTTGYTGRSSNYYNKQSGYGAYQTGDTLPACYTPQSNQDAASTTTTKDKTKKEAKETNVKLKKVENKENSGGNEKKEQESQVRVATWNREKKEFDSETKNKEDIYRQIEKRPNDKYTVFRSTKTLAAKLNIDASVLSSLTNAQLANRVSKIVYDEHVAGSAEEIKRLTENEKQFEEKAQKARKHIITLRGIINTVVKILSKSYQPGQADLTKQESEGMGNLWKFLYTNRKSELKHTSLGAFIVGLKKSQDKKKENA